MTLTTTPSIEGRTIVEYKGPVFGEVIQAINYKRDFSASWRTIGGGRNTVYEKELVSARQAAIGDLAHNASLAGADAVVGIRLDYQVVFEAERSAMVMVTATGTAVRLA